MRPQGEIFLSGKQQRGQRQVSIKAELESQGIELLRRRQVQYVSDDTKFGFRVASIIRQGHLQAQLTT